MKRILALIMSLAMLFSATELSFSVNAAGNSRTTMDEEDGPDVEGVAGVYYSDIMTRTNNGTYGRQFNTWYSGWYASMDRIEPIVRLIYAEAPW